MTLMFVCRIDDNAKVGNNVDRPLCLVQCDDAVANLDVTDEGQVALFTGWKPTINGVETEMRNGSLVLFADKQLLTWYKNDDGDVTLYADSENVYVFEVGE